MKKASKLSGVIVLVGIALATALLATWLSGIVEEDGSPVHPARSIYHQIRNGRSTGYRFPMR